VIPPASVDGKGTIPTPPAEATLTEAELLHRFEDIAQDGRLMIGALLPGLGVAGWRPMMKQGFAQRLMGTGMVPILTRLVIEGGGGPFSVNGAMKLCGTYGFSHVLDAGGEVDRIQLGMWLEASLPIGVTYGAPPDNAGELTVAGRVYAEHTVTRPFAAKEDRRVRRIEVEGLDPVPGPAVAGVAVASNATIPEGATLLDKELSFDPAPIVFGLAHTDSNQHVNSLVYLRIFEEALLRRMASHGKRGALLLRNVQIGYRKPCFAGEEVRDALQAFERQGRLGAIGIVVPGDTTSASDLARAHAFIAGWLG
jgi:hypothetical protein